MAAAWPLSRISLVGACLWVVSVEKFLGSGLAARRYATITGMLPGGRRSDWIIRYGTTDNLVLLAAVLLVVGLATFGFATLMWARAGFGNLTDPIAPCATIIGLSLVVIAIQIGFQAF